MFFFCWLGFLGTGAKRLNSEGDISGVAAPLPYISASFFPRQLCCKGSGKQNHQKSNQKYKNNKPKGARAKRAPPWGAAEGGALLFLLFLSALLAFSLGFPFVFAVLGDVLLLF